MKIVNVAPLPMNIFLIKNVLKNKFSLQQDFVLQQDVILFFCCFKTF